MLWQSALPRVAGFVRHTRLTTMLYLRLKLS